MAEKRRGWFDWLFERRDEGGETYFVPIVKLSDDSGISLDASDIEIGAVELKDHTTDDRARIAATDTIAEGDIAVAVHDPVAGVTSGAAVITDANGTIQQYLRGLVALWIAGLKASEAHIGSIGEHTAAVDVTPTLTIAGAYAANDFVGTSATAMTFAGCARVDGGYGMIYHVELVDYAKQSIAGELWLFNTAPAGLPVDNAAFTITDAAAKQCIGVVPFNTYYASALNSVSPVGNLTIGFKCLAGSMDLYGVFVTRGAPTYATGDLTFRLICVQD